MDVLIVDDEPSILAWMSATVKPLGLTPVVAESGARALAILNAREVGFVITDFMMPGMDGADLVREIRRQHSVLPIVVMSGVGSVDDAVNLLRAGADDFLTKPIKREVLLQRLEQIIEKARIYEEARLFRRFVEAGEEVESDAIITRSPVMLKLLRRLPAIARTDASVLVLGASGSGKELVARGLHKLSKRSEKPFVAVNCGALPETLVESTLFGHKKGAFTGADRDSIGLARSADGGTLFLDEIGDLPLNAQVKLLRFLQSKEVVPVGESRPVTVDVRIVAATHRDLRKAIEDGRFREDLYYRLNVISIDLPNLDERPEDIPVLANHFLQRYASQFGTPARAFSPEALSALVGRSWTGNVRELENAVQRAAVVCDGPVIDLSHLQLAPAPKPAPRPPAGPASSSTAAPATSAAAVALTDPAWRPEPGVAMPHFQDAKKDAIDHFERRYLEALLSRAPRMTEAAQLAGIDRKGLWRLLKKHKLRGHGDDGEVEGDEGGTESVA